MIHTLASLGIGPMSREVIRAVYSYAHSRRTPLMLIASKNQVDHTFGYVSTTAEFRTLCEGLRGEYPDALVYLCRDHCGPGFNGNIDIADVYRTIDEDIAQGFSLIHIDFSKLPDRKAVLDESRRAIEYITHKSPQIMIEIGTDENEGNDLPSITQIDNEVNFFRSFCAPKFYTCKTGSLVKETRQVGTFDRPYIMKVSALLKQHGLSLKEHNADYLTRDEISERRGSVSAMNIAPELGVLQTRMTLLAASEYDIETSPFLAAALQSKKWEKWLVPGSASTDHERAVMAGHYCFRSSEYIKLLDDIRACEDFALRLEQEIHALIEKYIEGLSLA